MMDARAQYRASFSGRSCRLLPDERLSRLTITGALNTSPGRTFIGGCRITDIAQGVSGGSAPWASMFGSLDVVEPRRFPLDPLEWPLPLAAGGRLGLAPSLQDDRLGTTGGCTGVWPFDPFIGVTERIQLGFWEPG